MTCGFAQDVFSYSLEYFHGDYQSVGATNHLMDKGTNNQDNDYLNNFVSLYNGNIGAMITNLTKQDETVNLQAQMFRYDNLNRIRNSVAVSPVDNNMRAGNNTWNNSEIVGSVIGGSFQNGLATTYTYDAGGNLQTLTRTDILGQKFDDFRYRYNLGTNQLNYIDDDSLSTLISSQDIEDQDHANFGFDSDGRLISDVKDGITNIIWTRDNRPKQVTKNFNGINEVINYHYDFQGFKIIQTINRNDSVFKQHYLRDPQGSVLAIYTDTSAINYQKLTLSELSIYGSSRIGTVQLDSVLYKQNGNSIVTPTISNVYAQKLGLKRYELSNHLGNVTTVITDRKIIQGNGQNAYFVADVISVTDYYAYGMKITERSWGKDARYQYNGKEQDKGMGRYNFGGRMYDERSCRWMSLDPQAGKYAGISPYVGFNNNPIMFVDPDGEEFVNPYSIYLKKEKNNLKKLDIMNNYLSA